MRFNHTTDKNIKQHPETGVYYFKRGSIEISLKTKDWNEAVTRKSLKVAEIDAVGTVGLKFTVGALAAKHRADRHADKSLRKGTKSEMDYIFDDYLLPFFGKKKLIKVDAVSWGQYCKHHSDLDLANHRKVFSVFLKWCLEKGYLRAMPYITKIPKYRRRKRRVLKPDELKRIFKHANGSLLTFLTLALYNGMRRKEIMTLRWSKVNLVEQHLEVTEEFNKKSRKRSLPINEIVTAVLFTHKRSSITSAWVFPNRKDRFKHADVSGLKTAWRTCLKRAELSDITWHDFRATYETHMDKSTEHTEIQKHKFSDASKDVRSRIYVNMEHADLVGLESVVKVDGLADIISHHVSTRGEQGMQDA